MEEGQTNKVWLKPSDVMNLHRLKVKKRALQARMNRTCIPDTSLNNSLTSSSCIAKRKNPFSKPDQNKKSKTENNLSSNLDSDASSDSTLFRLFNLSNADNKSLTPPVVSFSEAFTKLENQTTSDEPIPQGEKWIPIDWAVKTKLRFFSLKPFAWNRKLKTSEEASGITGFVRCLDTVKNTSLDTSPNAQFHQSCLYWQHPTIPWVSLFPRKNTRAVNNAPNLNASPVIKDSLHNAWSDSLRSLFQLVRARQCPYFYICANSFTAIVRAAGICGYPEMHVLLTPTTRGFRETLKKEDIQFTMPLKTKTKSDRSFELENKVEDDCAEETNEEIDNKDDDDDDEHADEEKWLESLGINADQIKKINSTQAKIIHHKECQLDNSKESLIFVEGVEAHALYNFLINCKSLISQTGALAGIPPTLLAPVAFHGASLESLKVKENKVCDNNINYFCVELSGPILPHTVHNLCSLLPQDVDMSASFVNISDTAPFSQVNRDQAVGKKEENSGLVFGQENLSDCGMNKELLKHFCSPDLNHVTYIETLKYCGNSKLYLWS